MDSNKSIAQAYRKMHEPKENEVDMNEAKIERASWVPESIADEDVSHFMGAAASAAKAGKKNFKFGDKTYKVTMKKDVAHKIKNEEVVEDIYEDDSYHAMQNAKAHAKRDGHDYHGDVSVQHRYDAYHMKKKGYTHFTSGKFGNRTYHKKPPMFGYATKIGPEHHQGVRESVEYNEAKAPDSVDSRQDLIKILKKHNDTKRIIGKKPIYFDDVDLVLGDKTVMRNPIFDDGTIEWAKIVKALKTTAKSMKESINLDESPEEPRAKGEKDFKDAQMAKGEPAIDGEKTNAQTLDLIKKSANMIKTQAQPK